MTERSTSSDALRAPVEVAVGLLRQGHAQDALVVLQDALDGKTRPAQSNELEPLELDLELPPEIPVFTVHVNGDVDIDDEGWIIPPEFVDRLAQVPWVGAELERYPGSALQGAELRIRELLTEAVKAGNVRKRDESEEQHDTQ